jgi:pimeloyl-ACP methyl ester carboxylesterase
MSRDSRAHALRAVLVLLTCATSLRCGEAAAQPLLRLPAPLEKVLQQSGVGQRGGTLPFLGDWQAILRPPERNAEFAALMERARREDQVLPLTHPLFAPENAIAGHWHSEFVLANYGTALFLAAPYAADRIPVILVHGINGTPRDFAALVPQLQESGYQAVYFVYPSGMALAGASRQLGERLREFVERHDIDRLAIIGHSLGGVVSKALLDEVDVHDDLQAWRVFISISSPFGGVDTAQYAERLPRHPPAWDDLARNSAFMHKVQSTSFPSDVRFYLVFSARSSARWMSTLGNNDGVLTLDSMVATPVTEAATDVFGFYEDHTSILQAARVLSRIQGVLATELGG